MKPRLIRPTQPSRVKVTPPSSPQVPRSARPHKRRPREPRYLNSHRQSTVHQPRGNDRHPRHSSTGTAALNRDGAARRAPRERHQFQPSRDADSASVWAPGEPGSGHSTEPAGTEPAGRGHEVPGSAAISVPSRAARSAGHDPGPRRMERETSTESPHRPGDSAAAIRSNGRCLISKYSVFDPPRD